MPLALYLCLLVLPVACWLYGGTWREEVSIAWRSWFGLVATTAATASAAAACAAVLGAVQAAALEFCRLPGARFLSVLIFVPFLTPPAVLTTAWHALAAGTPIGFLTHGAQAVILLSAFQLSPIVAWIVLRQLRTIGSSEIAAAQLTLSPTRRLRSIYAPVVASAALRGGVLVFLLLLPSREIGGYAGVETTGDRIVAAFTGGGSDLEGWLLVATLAIVTLPLLWVVIGPIVEGRPAPLSAAGAAGRPPFETRWPGRLLWLWIASWLIPFIALLFLAGSARASTAAIWGEGLFLEAMRTALLAVVLTAFGWSQAQQRSRAVWVLLLLPLFLPGTLPGLALATGVQHWLPPAVAETPLLMTVAQFVRFAGLATILARVARESIPGAELHAVQLLPSRRARATIIVQRALPALIIAGGVCVAVCLGEVESTSLLVPPGYVSPIVELHQFLHFRHDAHAGQLALGMVGVVLIVVGCGLAVGRHEKVGRSRQRY